MKQINTPILPLVIAFILLNIVLISAYLLYPGAGLDYLMLIIANAVFFLTSAMVFNMQRKAMANSNPQVFIRKVMVGVMLKMGVCLAFIMGYVFLTRPAFNRPAIYLSLVIYLVYLITEVSVVMKMNKRKHA